MRKAGINRKATAPSSDRCLAIIELLCVHGRGLSLTDIYQGLGISRNMAFRILTDLAARGYVLRDGDKAYRLSRRLLDMAVPRIDEANLVDEAVDEIRALRDASGEGVGLLVPSGGEVVLVYFQPSRQPARTVFDLGLRAPMHSNAPGKVFLTWMEADERQRILVRRDLQAFTARTITDRTRLLAELELVQQRGFATDAGEAYEGAHCAAAPIRDGGGVVVAALVITGLAQRMPEEGLPELGRMVAASAARISQRLHQ